MKTRYKSMKRDCMRMTNNNGINFMNKWCKNSIILGIEYPCIFNDISSNFFFVFKLEESNVKNPSVICLPYKNSGCKASFYGKADYYISKVAKKLKRDLDENNERVCYFHYRELFKKILEYKLNINLS